MPRYTADEIKEAWRVAPRIAHNQAKNALPLIEKEISKLKQERDIINDILQRELPEKPKKAAMGAVPEQSQEYARGDEDEAGGAGSQIAEPVKAEA